MSEHLVSERTRLEEGQLVMPFYLICDVSYSMSMSMVELNESVRRLRRAIVAEPVVDDVVQICIMTFSDTAKVIRPMGQMSNVGIPELAAEGGTHYGEAFRVLARTIEEDNRSFKSQGYRVYRPCAFFLTDGAPLDRDWHQTFTSTLTYDRRTGLGMKSHPIFVPFGFRNAPVAVLAQLAYPLGHGRWYHSKDASVEGALTGILDIIMRTVLTAGRTAGTGQPTITQQSPSPGSGIAQGDSEYDPDWV
jgi:uncharacterized protein YegL